MSISGLFDLTGKTALVTGAKRGIGRGMAEALAAAGADIIGVSATIETAGSAVGDAVQALGRNFTAHQLDFADKDAVMGFAKTLEADGAVPDILVNNAGITRDNLAMRMKDEEWHDVISVNMTATMRLCRSALRSMMKARWGRIISVSSIVGVTGNAGQTNYAASKAGMIGFSKSLAAEVASRGITVNVVAPGFIETPMTDVLADDQKANLLRNVPAGRLGQGAEIAAAVSYLASEEAGYTTGATLHVNGGMAMI